MAKKKINKTSSLADVCGELFKAANIQIVKQAADEVLFKSEAGVVIRITRKNDRTTVVQEYEDGSKRLLYIEVMEKFTPYESVMNARSRIDEALGL